MTGSDLMISSMTIYEAYSSPMFSEAYNLASAALDVREKFYTHLYHAEFKGRYSNAWRIRTAKLYKQFEQAKRQCEFF